MSLVLAGAKLPSGAIERRPRACHAFAIDSGGRAQDKLRRNASSKIASCIDRWDGWLRTLLLLGGSGGVVVRRCLLVVSLLVARGAAGGVEGLRRELVGGGADDVR